MVRITKALIERTTNNNDLELIFDILQSKLVDIILIKNQCQYGDSKEVRSLKTRLDLVCIKLFNLGNENYGVYNFSENKSVPKTSYEVINEA